MNETAFIACRFNQCDSKGYILNTLVYQITVARLRNAYTHWLGYIYHRVMWME